MRSKGERARGPRPFFRAIRSTYSGMFFSTTTSQKSTKQLHWRSAAPQAISSSDYMKGTATPPTALNGLNEGSNLTDSYFSYTISILTTLLVQIFFQKRFNKRTRTDST